MPRALFLCATLCLWACGTATQEAPSQAQDAGEDLEGRETLGANQDTAALSSLQLSPPQIFASNQLAASHTCFQGDCRLLVAVSGVEHSNYLVPLQAEALEVPRSWISFSGAAIDDRVFSAKRDGIEVAVLSRAYGEGRVVGEASLEGVSDLIALSTRELGVLRSSSTATRFEIYTSDVLLAAAEAHAEPTPERAYGLPFTDVTSGDFAISSVEKGSVVLRHRWLNQHVALTTASGALTSFDDSRVGPASDARQLRMRAGKLEAVIASDAGFSLYRDGERVADLACDAQPEPVFVTGKASVACLTLKDGVYTLKLLSTKDGASLAERRIARTRAAAGEAELASVDTLGRAPQLSVSGLRYFAHFNGRTLFGDVRESR